MTMTDSKMDSIELFSGTGGLALGLEMAGFKHTGLYEWDKDSCDNIQFNIENEFPVIRDWNVNQVDVRKIDYRQYAGKIRLVAGGPPCQPFSLGGKHKANNDKRDMFPEAIRAVREIRPEVFVFENVKGLLRESFRPYFEYIILQLTYPGVLRRKEQSWKEHAKMLKEMAERKKNNGLRYNVRYHLFNAADYGVPQVRQRVVIVGFRSDLNWTWEPPLPTHSENKLIYEKWVTHNYWIEHGMNVPTNPDVSENRIRNAKKAVEHGPDKILRWRTVRDAISDLPDPEMGASAQDVFDHDYRPGARIYAGHSGCSLDLPSKTIKAGAHGVPGGENMFIKDDGTVRYYTVRESARIQTFPDDYRFTASWTESMRQIGNAVPVRLAVIVGESVMRQLKEVLQMAASKNEDIPVLEPYNPLEKKHLASQVAEALMESPIQALPPSKFIGAGVYALYYIGDLDMYADLAEINKDDQFLCPIYVGKAIPEGARKGGQGEGKDQGLALYKRLNDHAKSVDAANNLRLEDFRCRFLAVDDIWIPMAESMAIERFKPVWNCLLEGFGNHDPGSGRKNMMRPSWDTVHPGRAWADRLVTPNAKTEMELIAEIKQYLRDMLN